MYGDRLWRLREREREERARMRPERSHVLSLRKLATDAADPPNVGPYDQEAEDAGLAPVESGVWRSVDDPRGGAA